MTQPDWRLRALAAIAEGFCPHQHGLLSGDCGGAVFYPGAERSFRPGGWCGACGVWYHTGDETVYAYYPVSGNQVGTVTP
jgi:hypothetical protein